MEQCYQYKGSLSYFNFFTSIFQNFPEKIWLCIFWANLFHYCDFLAILGPKIVVLMQLHKVFGLIVRF